MILVDAERYRDLFVQEARDHLAALTQGLESRAAAKDRDVIDALFRAAHSFKGMAATLGYTAESDLAHEVEDHLETARDNGRLADELRHRLVVATDLLSECVDCVESGRPRPELGQEIETLRSMASRQTPEAVQVDWDALQTAAEAIAPERLRVIRLRLDDTCAAPRARLIVIRRMLSTAGSVVAAQPETLEGGPTGLDHIIIVDSQAAPEAIAARLQSVPDVARHDVATELLDDTETSAATGPSPASAPAREGAADGDQAGETVLPRTIRVPLAQVDGLLDQAAELRIAYSRLEQRLDEIFVGNRPYRLVEALENLLREAKGIHDAALDLRTLPVRVITDRFPRLVRSLAERLDKDVRLEIEGEEVQADRSVLDAIVDPLTHLIKNALDHGLETAEERRAAGKPAQGALRLAFVRGPLGLHVSVSDDGRGIPRDAAVQQALDRGLLDPDHAKDLDDERLFRLLSTPGFSTAREVTDVSGRGVGLDAVKERLERVGGSMRIASQAGRGTTVTLELPPSLSLQEALTIDVDGEPYHIPVESILTVVPVTSDDISAGWVSIVDPDAEDSEPTETIARAAPDIPAAADPAARRTAPDDEAIDDPERPLISVRIIDLQALLDLPPRRHTAAPEDRDLKMERLKERLRGSDTERGRRRTTRREPDDPPATGPVGVVVERHGERACLLVPRVGVIREVVVKTLDPVIARSRHVAGATIQGDGRVGLILDVPSIVLAPPARPMAARR